jgi:hypothetical protein
VGAGRCARQNSAPRALQEAFGALHERNLARPSNLLRRTSFARDQLVVPPELKSTIGLRPTGCYRRTNGSRLDLKTRTENRKRNPPRISNTQSALQRSRQMPRNLNGCRKTSITSSRNMDSCRPRATRSVMSKSLSVPPGERR